MISFLKVSKEVVMSFCVAGVALRDILMCVITCRKSFWCDRRNIFDGLHFLWQAPQTTICTLYSALYTPHLHCTVDIPHLQSTLYTLHSALYTLHFTLHTLHSALYTLHSALYTLHSTLCTLHSRLHTLHTTFPTQHFTLHIFHSTATPFHTPESTLVRSQEKNIQHCWNNLFDKRASWDQSVCHVIAIWCLWTTTIGRLFGMVVDGCCCSGWLSSIIDVPKHPKHRNRPC